MMSLVIAMSSNGCAGPLCSGKKGVGFCLNSLKLEVLRMLMVLVWTRRRKNLLVECSEVCAEDSDYLVHADGGSLKLVQKVLKMEEHKIGPC